MYREIVISSNSKFSENSIAQIKDMNLRKFDNIDNDFLSLHVISKEQFVFVENCLKTHGDNYRIELNRAIYEIDDLKKFDFFYCSGQIRPNTTIEFVEFDIEKDSSFSKSSYCPKCRLGANQIKPLILKGISKKILEKKFLTPFWSYWLVNVELKTTLETQNMTGVDFLPIYNKAGKIVDGIYQIKPKTIIENSLCEDCYTFTKKYSKCDCDKNTIVFKNINNIFLNKNCLTNLNDFNELSERTEKRSGIYIISKKFLNAMLDAGIKQGKDAYFWPVQFK